MWLRLYGLYVDGIVNDAVHRRRVRSGDLSRLPSKWPPAFGIDLHIDDSEGVALEGRQLGFKVLVIRPDDANWVQSVLSTADDCEASAA